MRGPRVLVIGLDSLEAALWRRWAGDGTLPTLGGLLRDGAWGAVENPPGLYGGAAWSSFATAVNPGVHGRFCLRQAPPGEYVDRDHRPDEVGGTPFWVTLGDAGYRVAVLDVPHSGPSLTLNGLQLVDWGTHDPHYVGRPSVPPGLLDELDPVCPPPPLDPCEQVPLEEHALAGLRTMILDRVERKCAVTLHCLAKEPWDLFVSVFSEAHCAGHRFWFLHDTEHVAHDRRLASRLGDVVREVYAAIDHALGRIVAAVGPETRVFVVASHGMGPASSGDAIVLDEVLRRLGGAPPRQRWSAFALLKRAWYTLPRRVRDTAPLTELMSVCRTALRASLLIPERARRPFFAIPTDPFAGAVRINLEGRERHGIVAPADYRSLCERLCRDLAEIVIADTGEPWIDRLVLARDVFSGPRVDQLPDLLVQWTRAARVRAVRSPRIGTIRVPEAVWRSGDHRPGGFFAARGPGIAPGPLAAPVPIQDFAPTFAAILGASLPDVEGRPISFQGAKAGVGTGA